MDNSEQIDHAEHAFYSPCPDCGGPQWDNEHREDCPRVAAQVVERTNPRTGRVEFRAYPHGTTDNGGGAGPWTPDRDAATANLAAALAVDAERAHADAFAAKLAGADWRIVAAARDLAADDLWRHRDDPDGEQYRRALARRTVAEAELRRTAKTLTGYSSTGQTATLSFTPGGIGGNAWVMLDRDRGVGSMSYPDSLELWTITGGNPVILRVVVEHMRERAHYRDRNNFPTDTPGARHFRAWLADVEALADDTERSGIDAAAVVPAPPVPSAGHVCEREECQRYPEVTITDNATGAAVTHSESHAWSLLDVPFGTVTVSRAD